MRFARHCTLLSAGALSVIAMASPASAASGGTAGAANLQCFSGPTDGTIYGGTCSTGGNNRNSATLNNSDSNANGDYAGVYLNKKDVNGKLLSSITALGYSYSSTSTPSPGDLSLNIGVDTTGDGLTDAYAYIDAAYCAGTNGTVNIVSDANCGIWFVDSGAAYPNWATFVAAHPTATVAAKDGQPFIVAERTPSEGPATWTISNVVIGRVS